MNVLLYDLIIEYGRVIALVKSCSVVLKSVTRERHYRPVFKPVTLSAIPGDVWHVQGLNGAGKTSLLKIIAGISHHTGQCHVSGGVAYSGHEPCVYGHFDVIENLNYTTLNAQHYSTQHWIEQCAIWQLPERRSARQLSAGQRQALNLLRIIHSGAGCWLLDESTQCLDVDKAQLWAQACQQHVQAGGVIFLTTHMAQDLLLSMVTQRITLEAMHV